MIEHLLHTFNSRNKIRMQGQQEGCTAVKGVSNSTKPSDQTETITCQAQGTCGFRSLQSAHVLVSIALSKLILTT